MTTVIRPVLEGGSEYLDDRSSPEECASAKEFLAGAVNNPSAVPAGFSYNPARLREARCCQGFSSLLSQSS